MTDDPRNPAPGPDRFDAAADAEADAAFDAWLRESGLEAGVAELLAETEGTEAPPVRGVDELPALPHQAEIDAQIARALEELPVAEPVTPPVVSLAERREKKSLLSRWSVPVGAVAASVLAVVGFSVLVLPDGGDDADLAISADETTDTESAAVEEFSADIETDAAEEALSSAAGATADADSTARTEAPAETEAPADTEAPAEPEGSAESDVAADDATDDPAAADDGAEASGPSTTAAPTSPSEEDTGGDTAGDTEGDTGLELLPDECLVILDELLADLGAGDLSADGDDVEVVEGDAPDLVDVTIESIDGPRRLTFDVRRCDGGDPIVADVPLG